MNARASGGDAPRIALQDSAGQTLAPVTSVQEMGTDRPLALALDEQIDSLQAFELDLLELGAEAEQRRSDSARGS